MFFGIFHLNVRQRMLAWLVACALVGMGWFAVSAFWSLQRQFDGSLDRRWLAVVERAAVAAEQPIVSGELAELQKLVEQLTIANPGARFSVVASDGRIVADSQASAQGTFFREPVASHRQVGKCVRVRFRDALGGPKCEYRWPLERGSDVFGALHLAVERIDLAATAWAALGYVPWTLAGPLAAGALFFVVLAKVLKPFISLERELGKLASVPAFAGLMLNELPGRGAAVFGWNRLIDHVNTAVAQNNLGERLSQAINARSQHHWEEVFDALPDGIAVTDADGFVTYANRALGALVGTLPDASQPDASQPELCGQHIAACLELGENDAELVQPAARAAVAEIERPGDGTTRVWRVARHPLFAEGHASSRQVWSVRDISQQRLAEEMRDQFLDAASHELRTPLANIRAYAETLSLSEEMEIERQKEFCNTINAEASRLARLIDDLLNISSIEVGSLSLDRQETDIERLLREVVGKVSPQMEQKQIVLETAFPEKWPKMAVDKDKVASALVNLLGNAAKYTPEGGRVSLRAKTLGNQFVVEVEDTGYGIAPDDLARVFDKFFRSDDPRVQRETGSGLGLSLTQEIIEMHGGTLQVASELNAGTRFTATLPLGV